MKQWFAQNFNMLRQNLIIRYVRFWQLPFAKIWQLIGIFTMKLRPFTDRQGWYKSLSPLQLYFSQTGKFQFGRCSSENESWKMKPDLTAVLYSSKKIAIGTEVYRPPDAQTENLVKSYGGKREMYNWFGRHYEDVPLPDGQSESVRGLWVLGVEQSLQDALESLHRSYGT